MEIGKKEKKGLKSEIFQKYLEDCIDRINSLDKDLSLALDQMETEARERTTDYYYRIIGKNID
jgi:ribosome assembly protein YihI (activator of Der GTPase)